MEARMKRVDALLLTLLLWGCCPGAVAQDFKVLWTPVGEVVSAGKDAVPIQGGAKVVRVDVEPAIVPTAVGKQICVSTLQLRAFGPDGRALAGVPLSIIIRDDQKAQLQLTHPKGDLCVRPASAGEYPIRFTSKLPAPDDTKRGAQIYLRVS
jgi:hypothetical protein